MHKEKAQVKNTVKPSTHIDFMEVLNMPLANLIQFSQFSEHLSRTDYN